MEKIPRNRPDVSAGHNPPQSNAIPTRYREAVRARYLADHAGSSPTLAARLEERCRRFEAATMAVEAPFRPSFLASADLIRAGELTRAQCLFEAGMAALPVEVPEPPAEVEPPPSVDVGVADVATREPLTPSEVVALRYREAVRAWFIAAQAGGATREDRLEGSVRGIEDAAAATEMPSLWYWLESARLIRAGDLAGAQGAFEAGGAPPSEPPAPAVDAVAIPSAVEVVDKPRPLLWDRLALAGYLVLLTIAEIVVTFGNPVTVFTLDGVIVALAALHVAILEGRADEEAGHDRLTPALLTIIVVASIRIISLTLPLAAIEPAYRYLLAGIPMVVGAVLVARAAHYSMRDVGLVWRKWRMQVLVIAVSMGLGFVEYAILQPAPLGPLPWMAGGVLPAIVVGLATGFPEELIFRGVLQTATRPVLGRLNWVYASLVFAVLHIGYMSPIDLVFVFGVGLLYGWVFKRSRSIIGISIAHGQANVVLFFIAPNLPAFTSWVASLGS